MDAIAARTRNRSNVLLPLAAMKFAHELKDALSREGQDHCSAHVSLGRDLTVVVLQATLLTGSSLPSLMDS